MLSIYLRLLDTEEEQARFKQIYEQYRNLMFYVANGILKDKWLSEDAVHEAFIRIAKNFSKIGEISCHRTKNFVFVIVRNVALTILEKEGKNTHEEYNDELHFDAIDAAPDSDSGISVLKAFEYEDLLSAITKLPDIYRDTLYLRYFNDFNMAEIASALGISRETAKKRSQRAVKMLADILRRK
mgnify:CR=1 FL=1